MEEHHGSELVIRITPRNLERLIYVLIILGLLIFSVVQFAKKTPDCPAVDCENQTLEVEEEVQTAAPNVSAAAAPAEEEEEETVAAPKLSGEVEFLLTDVQTCIINESEDKGSFDSISVYIKNGLSRTFKGRIDFYMWDNNDDAALKQYPSTKIEGISILSGAPLTRKYTVDLGDFSNRGMFDEIAKAKTVKAILVDTELNAVAGEEQLKTGLETEVECE